MPKLPRKWTLSLRGLMAAVLCLAVGLGWKVNKAREQREAAEAIKKHGGSLSYDWSGPPTKGKSGRTPPGPEWLRRALGDEYFQDIVYVNLSYARPQLQDVTRHLGSLGALVRIDLPTDGSQATDATCADLSACRGLEILTLSGKAVTDAGVERLTNLASLRVLRVSDASLGDASPKILKALPALEDLDLHGTRFTEEALRHAAGMAALKRLSLGGGPEVITEAGLAHLKGLEGLETLMFPHSKITDDGMKVLEAMPGLKVLFVGNASISTEARERLRSTRPDLSVFP